MTHIPAKKEAFETVLGQSPAKHLCPISCSIIMNKKGINIQEDIFEEAKAKPFNCGIKGAKLAGGKYKTNTKDPSKIKEKTIACAISVEITALSPPCAV